MLSWLLTITGTFKYLLAIFVIARMLAYGSTAAALIVLRRRDGPRPCRFPAESSISVLALAPASPFSRQPPGRPCAMS